MNPKEDLSQKSEISRFVAYKISILDLVNSQSNSDNVLQWNDNVLGTVNIVGIVISLQEKETYNNVYIDDGTGSVAIRSFDKNMELNFVVGDIIQVVGRPRVFGQEKYVAPEIIKKMPDPKWVAVRRREIDLLQKYIPKTAAKKVQVEEKKPSQHNEDCVNLIRQLDSGEGVNVDLIIAQSIPENIIYELLKMGTIFETKPGTVKILE